MSDFILKSYEFLYKIIYSLIIFVRLNFICIRFFFVLSFFSLLCKVKRRLPSHYLRLYKMLEVIICHLYCLHNTSYLKFNEC